ncbi:MAG: hypothetical protein IKH57_17090 [Clostridia bacterium]|nr:hypothetical protein [Clostridia bacterium]
MKVKRIVTITVLMFVIFCMLSSSVFAIDDSCCVAPEETEILSNQLAFKNDVFYKNDLEGIKEELITLNALFPDAHIDIEEAMDLAQTYSDLTTEEQISYYDALCQNDPEIFTRNFEDGSSITLELYGTLAYQTHGVTLGSSSTVNNVTYYSGSTIWAHNVSLSLGANASYQANHYYNNNTSEGWITSTYNDYCYGGFPVVIGLGRVNQSSGSYSDVWYRLYTGFDGSGVSTYSGTMSLKFYATTFNTSLVGVVDPYI